MALKLYKEGSFVRLDGYYANDATRPISFNAGNFRYREDNDGNYLIKDDTKAVEYNLLTYDNVTDKYDESFSSQAVFEKYISSLGSIDVNIQDQTTPSVDFYFIQALGAPTTLTADTDIDDTTITIDDTTNFVDGTYVAIFKPLDNRFYFGTQIGAPVGSVITLDTPIDYDFEIGDTVLPATRELNVNGSVTPEVFAVQGAGSTATVSIDITRIIISMICAGAPDDGLFGNIAALTNGIVLRRVDGDTRNVWNVKSNGDLANLSYDVAYTTRTVPLGSYGVRCRYTFAGQDKHGVAVRLSPGDALQLIVQDDLQTITSFRIVAAGHVVED